VNQCVDLCSGTGGFSSAFREIDEWDVLTVDVNPECDPDMVADVRDLNPSDLPTAEVYLASPPCPEFSFAGNHDHWEGRRPIHPDARDAVALARHVQALCETLGEWWVLENPKGRLSWIFGRPRGTVHYCQYGKSYMKPTFLWGRHPPGLDYRQCPGPECHHTSNTEDDGTSAIQSMPSNGLQCAAVPFGLSESILQAVEGQAEQQTLGSVEP